MSRVRRHLKHSENVVWMIDRVSIERWYNDGTHIKICVSLDLQRVLSSNLFYILERCVGGQRVLFPTVSVSRKESSMKSILLSESLRNKQPRFDRWQFEKLGEEGR